MTTSTVQQQQQAATSTSTSTIIPNTICSPVSDDNDSLSQIGLNFDANDDALLSEVQVRKSIHEDDDDDDDLECISAVSSNNDDNDNKCDDDEFDDIINPNSMRRVSSCFFSVASGYSRSSFSDLRGLVIEEEEHVVRQQAERRENNQTKQAQQEEEDSDGCFNAVDILYHDIMMNILSFLPLSSLSSFSATARRPNFECFYFLELQFERSLSSTMIPQSSSSLFPSISGTGAISRLSKIDPTLAKKLVNDYLDSNSSLRNMPLSQRLAYLIRDGKFFMPRVAPTASANNNNMAAAMLVLLGGACASYMGTEIPSGAGQALLSMGLGGAIMQAASSKRQLLMDEDERGSSRDTSSGTKRRNNYHIPVPHFPNIFHHNRNSDNNNRTATNNNNNTTTNSPRTSRKTTTTTTSHNNETKTNDLDDRAYILSAMQHPHTSNPYSHFNPLPQNNKSSSSRCYTPEKKTPTGCVGAYTKSIRRATMELTKRIKQSRLSKFKTLPLDEQLRLGTRFIDACTTNDGLSDLIRIVQREGIDVDGFYVGSDGTETCGLHIAAFHGASEIVRYLCSPIDEFCSDGDNDGGLCNIDLCDDNGWTACHFASGANSVASVKILAEMGADLTIEAGNGYKPYHWAERLSNEEVMTCLKGFGADERFLELRKWVGGAESLWLFGERFWGMIPAGNG